MRRILTIFVLTSVCGTVIAGEPKDVSKLENQIKSRESGFAACVKREAELALNRTVARRGETALYGYHREEFSEVYARCHPGETVTVEDGNYVSRILEEFAHLKSVGNLAREEASRRKQAERDAPRIAAGEAQFDSSARLYTGCLRRSAYFLAINSTESADVLSLAVFASCTAPRQNMIDTYRGIHHYPPSYEFMEGFDGSAQKHVILDIVKARAERLAPPVPVPAPAAPRKEDAPI